MNFFRFLLRKPLILVLFAVLFTYFCSTSVYANDDHVFLDEAAIKAKILQRLQYRIDQYQGDRKSIKAFLTAIDCLTPSCLDSAFRFLSPTDAAELLRDLHIDIPIDQIQAFNHERGYDHYDENSKFHKSVPPILKDEKASEETLIRAEVEKIKNNVSYFKEATKSIIINSREESTVVFLGRSPALLSLYFKEYIARNRIHRNVVNIDFSGKANIAPDDLLDPSSNEGLKFIESLTKNWVSKNRFESYASYLDAKFSQHPSAPLYIVDKADSGNGMFSFMHLLDRYLSARKKKKKAFPEHLTLLEMGHLMGDSKIHDMRQLGTFPDTFKKWQHKHPAQDKTENCLQFQWVVKSLFSFDYWSSLPVQKKRDVMFRFPTFVEEMGRYEDWQAAGDAVYYPPYFWDRFRPIPTLPGPLKAEIIKVVHGLVDAN